MTRFAFRQIGLILTVLFLVVSGGSTVAFGQTQQLEYRLGSGDKLRITVFGEDDLSGEFEVDGGGRISMPLIGSVNVGQSTLKEAASKIVIKLKDGYMRDPRVSVDVLNYRPFYIIGEVNTPGSYPYRSGLSVLTAVAMGGGYTFRADEDDIIIIRGNDPERREEKASPDTVVLPGDVVRVEERLF